MKLLTLAAIFAVLYCALGCSKSADPAPAPAEHVYTVRGQVAMLPDPAKPGSSFQVKHEAIDQFVRQNGTLGMDSMTMPFPLASGVSAADLAVGDKIELTFEVRWKSKPHFQTTKIVRLPAETPLVFGKTSPAK